MRQRYQLFLPGLRHTDHTADDHHQLASSPPLSIRPSLLTLLSLLIAGLTAFLPTTGAREWVPHGCAPGGHLVAQTRMRGCRDDAAPKSKRPARTVPIVVLLLCSRAEAKTWFILDRRASSFALVSLAVFTISTARQMISLL